MVINLSEETIKTARNALWNSRQNLKFQLEVSIPSGKVAASKKETIQHQLEEVEDALFVFEEMLDSL